MLLKQLFKVPSALTLAYREREDTKRELLNAHATAEHATKMVEYYQGVVTRLDGYIQTETQRSQ